MLSLLKYNWRKMSTLFYSLVGLTVIVNIMLLILDSRYGWWDEITIGVSLLFVSMVLQLLNIVIIYNYNATLKSIIRRLLPIGAVKEYISHLILPILYNTIFTLIIFVFVLVLNPFFKISVLNEFIASVNMWEVALSLLLFSIFYSVLGYMMYFMSVAITRLFRTNLKVLIFIVILFATSILYAIIIGLLQQDPEVMHRGNILFIANETGIVSIEWFKFSWTILIDLAIMAIMSFVSVYILKNKLEV